MKQQLPIVLILLLASAALPAQISILGKVLDAETREPIPYVNIGVRELAVGTVSNANGDYALHLPSAEDVVAFSSIGYQTVEVNAGELSRNGVVALTRKKYRFREVEVTARKFGEEQIFGERNETRGPSVGFGSRQLGAEIGSLIELKAPTLIKSAHFVLNHAQGDSMLFRVNIYDYRDGQVGENVLRENIFIVARQKRGAIDVDLSGYDLILEGDVLLSLQWIRDDRGEGNVGITFDTKKGKSLKGIYVKDSSIGVFRKLTHQQQFKPCFYMIGKQ